MAEKNNDQKPEAKAAQKEQGAQKQAAKTPKDKLSMLKEEVAEGAKSIQIDVPLKEKLPPIPTAPKPAKAQPISQAPKKPAAGQKLAGEAKAAVEKKQEAAGEAKEKGSEEEMILHDIVKEAEQEALKPGAIVHRRYLIGGKGGPTPAGVKVKKPGEEPEFTAMMQEVYGQVKKEAPAKPVRPVAKRPEKKEEKKPEEAVEEKKVTLEDILGTPKNEEGAGGEGGGAPAPLFAELEAITGKPAAPKPAEKPPAAEAKPAAKAAAAQNVCPTCSTKDAKVIFCPYCGAGFCTNCSPSVRPTPDAFYYVCPKCSEEVTVKRK
jgi:hypothetical protein